MTNTQRPYTGFDKIGNKTHPAAAKLADLLKRRHKMTYMGGLSVRVMRSAPAAIQKLAPTDPRCKPYMSVHASGRAVDVGLEGDPKEVAAKLTEIADYLVANATEFYLEEVHQYSWRNPAAPKGSKVWGRGYRCSRAKKDSGWLAWDAKNNGGTPGGLWIHFEVSPHANPVALEAHFRATK